MLPRSASKDANLGHPTWGQSGFTSLWCGSAFKVGTEETERRRKASPHSLTRQSVSGEKETWNLKDQLGIFSVEFHLVTAIGRHKASWIDFWLKQPRRATYSPVGPTPASPIPHRGRSRDESWDQSDKKPSTGHETIAFHSLPLSFVHTHCTPSPETHSGHLCLCWVGRRAQWHPTYFPPWLLHCLRQWCLSLLVLTSTLDHLGPFEISWLTC